MRSDKIDKTCHDFFQVFCIVRILVLHQHATHKNALHDPQYTHIFIIPVNRFIEVNRVLFDGFVPIVQR